MRILFLPVYDPSHHAVSVANKHGLHDALIAAGHVVREIDYCAIPLSDLWAVLASNVVEFEPDLMLCQLQGVDRLDWSQMANLRRLRSEMMVCNFNQDYWPEHHTTPDMLALLRHVDLQLVSNGSVLPDYAANGVNAAYWPFGYETPVRPLPEVPHHDVVFLGNAYSEHRRALGKLLKSLPYNVGLYGTGWENGDGDCNYDFTYGEALYKNAKIAISDNEFTDAVGYLSNRPFQILAAGGAILLQERVEQLTEYTGLESTKNCLIYVSNNDMCEKFSIFLSGNDTTNQHERLARIVKDGQQFVREHHSYDVRVRELMAMVEGLRV